jgi:GxxExxY protein
MEYRMRGQNLLHGELTDRIIGEFLQVHHELGPGFVESIYSRSMGWALHDAGLQADLEVPISVHFRGRIVGSFRADIVVESLVLLELKVGDQLDPNAEAQVVNYLRATRLELALILHFGPKPAFRRLILTNDRKLLPQFV